MINKFEGQSFHYDKGRILDNGVYEVNFEDLFSVKPDLSFIGENIFVCGSEAALGLVFYYSNCILVSSIGLRNSSFRTIAIPTGFKNISLTSLIPPINTFFSDLQSYGDSLYIQLPRGKLVNELLLYIKEKLGLEPSEMTLDNVLGRSHLLNDNNLYLTIQEMNEKLLGTL